MMKKYLSMILVLLLLTSRVSMSYAEVLKNETVYVNLDFNGKTKDITVVNHISGNSDDEYFVEYGKYNSLQVLVNGVDPIVEENTLKWPTSFLANQDIYYEGTIEKELPIDISINYYLNGEKIEATEVSGKTGDFKIEISIKNNQELTTQIQIPLDLDVFTDVVNNGGVGSVVGKTMTVVYTHLPMGDATYTLEAYGENIYLDPIIMASTSQSIEIPDTLTSGIDQLSSGIDELSDATKKLEDGSREITNGTNSLVGGLKSLSSGISKLYSGSSELNTNSDKIIGGFQEINSGIILLKDNMSGVVSGVNDTNTGLSTLNAKSGEINTGLNAINEGLGGLSGGISSLDSGLIQLNSSHKQLLQLANALASSTDPNVKALAEGVIGESIAIDSLSQGATASSNGIKSLAGNTNTLASGFGEFSGGLDAISKGFNKLNEGLKPVPTSLEELVNGHTKLINGINPLFKGIEELSSGIGELNSKTKAMPGQVQKLSDGQVSISDGLKKLNEEGLMKIKDSLGAFDFEDDKTKEPYTSFVDNEKNKNSNVQFVMKTPAIQINEVADISKEPTKEKQSLWDRFLDLFR